jgi:predicted metalloprotease with PDZ domain
MDLFSKDDLARVLSGAMRDAVRAHGPITEVNVASAAKRAAGHLQDQLMGLGREACADAGLRMLLAKSESERKFAVDQVAGLRRNRHKLLRLLKKHGISPAEPEVAEPPA